MKKTFEYPVIKVIKVEAKDVISTSSGNDDKGLILCRDKVVRISLLLKDGTDIPFAELNDTYKRSEVLGVLVREEGMQPFVVSPTKFSADMLDRHKEYNMYGEASERECDAIVDHGSKVNTDAMFDGGCHAAVHVRENLGAEWNIPALGVLCCICRHKNYINKVLARVDGATLLKNDIHWSSTEDSASFAWGMYFSNGGIYGYLKSTSSVVRPVAAYPKHQ